MVHKITGYDQDIKIMKPNSQLGSPLGAVVYAK